MMVNNENCTFLIALLQGKKNPIYHRLSLFFLASVVNFDRDLLKSGGAELEWSWKIRKMSFKYFVQSIYKNIAVLLK